MAAAVRLGRRLWAVIATALLVASAYWLSYVDTNSTAVGGHCSLDDVNGNASVPQDDPCVVELIRRRYLHPPPSGRVGRDGVDGPTDDDEDPSAGQSAYILRLLDNKTGGFFVECGAYDGHVKSNSVHMERRLGWTGVLVEANPHLFAELDKRHRNAWTVPACLSIRPYPTKVKFSVESRLASTGKLTPTSSDDQVQSVHQFDVQCFPLYSILLAVGRTSIDYFSLDVEGHELAVLQTIPWHKVDIKTLTVERIGIAQGERGLVDFMAANGYDRVATVDFVPGSDEASDVVFQQSSSAGKRRLFR